MSFLSEDFERDQTSDPWNIIDSKESYIMNPLVLFRKPSEIKLHFDKIYIVAYNIILVKMSKHSFL